MTALQPSPFDGVESTCEPGSPERARADRFGKDSSPSSLHDHLSQDDLQVVSRLKSVHTSLLVAPKPSNQIVAALQWWKSWALPGMGMFSEAYIIFAIGNITPLLAIQYPTCFGDEQPWTCSQKTVSSVQYVEICGIIAGMLAFGYLADIIGRKWGSRVVMSLMFVGACLLTGAYGSTSQQFLSVFCFSLFFYGAGVGGEYPLASASAAERAEGSRESRKRRGGTVVLTFSQQGWGNFANTLVILILLAMQGATTVVTESQAQLTWRVQFGVGAFICFLVSLYRWIYLEESAVWQAEHAEVAMELEAHGDADAKRGRRSMREYTVILKHYLPRLFITCAGWVANDFAFYGNKLFQATFISAISGPDASIFKMMQWTLLNSAVALTGYYVAAWAIDKEWYRRVRMQAFGFFMMFVLFLTCGVFYNQLINNAIQVFQFLYFFSSFWNQLGPNCTTWLVAGEVYPTDVRAFFHGISAAFGKAGAAIAAAMFTDVSSRTAMYASAGAGIVGLVLTVVFLPDTTGLDLEEIDRWNRYLLAGQLHNYHGEAANPRFLSLYERWRGYGKHYDPEMDAAQKELQAGGLGHHTPRGATTPPV